MVFTLSVAGRGTDRERVAELAADSGGAICLVDGVPHTDVPDLLAAAHVGVLPFADEEKFRVSSPIKLFEYMASAMPILATRVACNTDVVRDGRFAFWADDAGEDGLFEALKGVWISRLMLPGMGREAALAAKSWTWAASAEKLAEALRSGMREVIDGSEDRSVRGNGAKHEQAWKRTK
jgi:glycosyltransferase involved in cell wall biosynthesis